MRNTKNQQFQPLERRSGLTPQQFKKEHIQAKQPVILTDFLEGWKAQKFWTFDYFKEKVGHLEVPLYDQNYSIPGKGYMQPTIHKTLREYIEMLEAGPTDYRMFLYNIFNEAPELLNDLGKPTLTGGFLDSFPFMFFGGKGSEVTLHYDIDHSSVFLNQFEGRKRIIIFSPEQSKYLYQHPFTVKSHINPMKPDLERYPAFANARGYECILEPGETLFMPPCFWHFVYYEEPSFSISLRSNPSLFTRGIGIMQIVKHYIVDKGMNLALGKHWYNLKESIADKRAIN